MSNWRWAVRAGMAGGGLIEEPDSPICWGKSVSGRGNKCKGSEAALRVSGAGAVGGCECRDHEQEEAREGAAGTGLARNQWAGGYHSNAEGRRPVGFVMTLY